MLNKDIYNDDYYTDNQDYEYDEENEEALLIIETEEETENRKIKEKEEKSNQSGWFSIANDLIKRINNHPFFSTNKEDDPYLHDVEANKLYMICYNYALCRYKSYCNFRPFHMVGLDFHFESNLIPSDYDLGDVISSTVTECIEDYNPEMGNNFDHYLNKALSVNLSRKKAVFDLKEYSKGMYTSQDLKDEKAILFWINHYPKIRNIPESMRAEVILNDIDGFSSLVSAALKIKEDKIKDFLNHHYNVRFIDGDAPQSDDNDDSKFSALSDQTQDTIEDMINTKEAFSEFGQIADKILSTKQARTVPFLSAFFVNLMISKCQSDPQTLIAEFENYDFFDAEFAAEVQERINNTHRAFSLAEIAERYNKTNPSKVVSNFMEEFKQELIKARLW